MKHPARTAFATAAMLAAAAATVIAAFAIPTFASAAPASSKIAATPTAPVLVDYFFGELSPANGSSTWVWASSTADAYFANSTSRAIVAGNITLGSSNGLAVSGQLGVCYQQGTGPIRFGNFELINFTAPKGQWVSQSVAGTILPGANGLATGLYQVGLCVNQTSANLVYDAVMAGTTGNILVAEDSGSSAS